MGVISGSNNPFYDEIDQTLDEIIKQNIQDENATARAHTKVKNRRPNKPESIYPFHHRPKGSRKRRRFEDADELYMFADPDDLEEININHFMSNNMSAFAKLLMERENMEAWNDFVNSSEDDLDDFLHQFKCSGVDNDVDGIDDDSMCNSIESGRHAHPAYSAKECFYKIDRELRQLLKKHVPVGLIADLEENLTSFFVEFPQAIYDCLLPDSYHRLMLHAVCQYYSLQSNSYNKKGTRRTKVKNRYKEFHVSSTSMCAFLENVCNITNQ